MPAVGAVIAAAGAALSGAAAAIGGSVVLSTFAKLAVGLALTQVSRMLFQRDAPSYDRQVGARLQVDIGEDSPRALLLGRCATAGGLVYNNSWGRADRTPNAFFVQVFELSDFPCALRRVWINGEWCTLSASTMSFEEGGKPDMGLAVDEYRKDTSEYLWIKFRDGTDTTPDDYLRAKFGADKDRPWDPDMIGRGVPHVIVTARLEEELHRGAPQCLFEVGNPSGAIGGDGLTVYDPRLDSTAGGSGSHRVDNVATWEYSNNSAVLAYNVMLGFDDRETGEHSWGGQDISAEDLDAATWFAAMNECDQSGDRYRAGLEVRIGAKDVGGEAPADVVERLLESCQGNLAEVGGRWYVRAGAPASAVFAFTDDDVVITEALSLDPFPPLDQTYNGVAASLASPDDGWRAREAPLRFDADYQTEDGGRRNIAALRLDAVWSMDQAQRIQKATLKDARRMRRHAIVLPPEARALTPLDVVAWTSAANGYADKDFEIAALTDLPNGNCAVALREVDPTDYDFDAGDLLPSDGGYVGRPIIIPVTVLEFAVEPAYIFDADGVTRRPAIRLLWNPRVEGVTGLRFQIRLAVDHTEVPAGGDRESGKSTRDGEAFTLGGEDILLGGEPLLTGIITDFAAGEALTSDGLLPATAYEVRAIYTPKASRKWTNWLPVTTPDQKLSFKDLEANIEASIDKAEADAAAAQIDALNALQDSENALFVADGVEADVQLITAQVEASFGDWDSFVSETSTAVATADKAASSYVLRAGAGGVEAGLRVTAWEDEDASGSLIYLDAEQTIASGSLYANALVIGARLENLVRDPFFEDDRYWGIDPDADDTKWNIGTGSSAATALGSRSNYLWAPLEPTETKIKYSPYLGVQPSAEYAARVWLEATGGAPRSQARVQLRFYDADGVMILSEEIAAYDGTSPREFVARLASPSTAASARFRLIADAGNGRCRFGYMELREQLDGGVMIRDRTIGGAQLITTENLITSTAQIADGMIVRAKIGNAEIGTAQIENLTITTGKLPDRAIVDPYFSELASTFDLDQVGGWYTILQITIERQAQSTVAIDWSKGTTSAEYSLVGDGRTTTVGTTTRLRRNTTTLTGSGGMYNDSSNVSGTVTYRIQAMSPAPPTTVEVYDRDTDSMVNRTVDERIRVGSVDAAQLRVVQYKK